MWIWILDGCRTGLYFAEILKNPKIAQMPDVEIQRLPLINYTYVYHLGKLFSILTIKGTLSTSSDRF